MKGFDVAAILLNPEFGRMLLHGLQMTFLIAIGSWDHHDHLSTKRRSVRGIGSGWRLIGRGLSECRCGQ